ncbi:MAG: peroxiredoxin [Actinobacteria bacterium]|nr:peroxiredoxin [Actinomycetota bacterium]MCB9413340.1 peroxiredoxin [Actinomycetota bacterium]
MSVQLGTPAPDFELPNQHGQKVRLSDFRGKKNVVVVFYPFAFTGVCTGELCVIRDEVSDFVADGVETLAISCDPVPSLKVFAESNDLGYSLLSDFWPHGETAKAYGVFLPDTGFATRGTFIIDTEGIVRWSVVNGPGEARSTDEYRAALAQLG